MSTFWGRSRRLGWARPVWYLAIGLSAVLAVNAADSEHDVGMESGAGADIRLTVPGGRAAQAGFLPVQVRITNRSNKERSWAVEIRNQVYGFNTSGSRALHSSHDCTVPAAATREFLFYAPVLGSAGRSNVSLSTYVLIDGPEVVETSFQFALGSNYVPGSVVTAPFALEPKLEDNFRRYLPKEAGIPSARPRPKMHSGNTHGDPLENGSLIDPSLWPADWRLWSRFAQVILEKQKWDLLDTAHRRALLDWVALGGRLALLAPTKMPRETQTQPHGAGKIVTLKFPLPELLEERSELLELGNDANLTDPAGSLAAAAFWNLDTARWQLEAKTGWLTLFIAVFGLLIGPVNIFWLAPQGKRHRLFLTVPVISLGASLALFGIIAIRDGFGGEGTRRALVVLLPEQNQAAVFQRQISLTGLLGERKFSLAADTLCDRETDSGGVMAAGLECWRAGDEAWGDWFTNRSTQQQFLRRLSPTRERVELVPGAAGASPVVQSTLATTLRSFLYRDEAGELWSATEVPPGTRVTLRQDPKVDLRYAPAPGRSQFSALGGATAVAPLATLDSIRWRDDLILYCGRLSATTLTLP